MAFLQTSKTETTPEETFPLVCDSTIIGRHPCCEIVLDHGAVSREHARIIREPDGYFIEDLHSRNGTMLNGRLIDARTRMFDGDIIRVCDAEFHFISDTSDTKSDISGQFAEPQSQVVVEDNEEADDPINIISQINLAPQKGHINPANAELKLKALIDIGRNLHGDINNIMPQLLENLLRIFRQADCACILLFDEQTKRLELKAYKHRNPQTQDSVRVSRSILERIVASKAAILSDNAGEDSRFDPTESIVNYHIFSVMAVPIMDSEQNECLGVIQVDSRSGGKKFTYNELDLLVSVAYQIAIVIENAKLHGAMLKERIMEGELNIAHKVQRGFLPVNHPEIEHYEFFDYYQPAKFLGGDYYDYIPLPNGLIAIAVGDVSGKGISAALLMAKLSADVRYCLLMEPSFESAMKRLNNSFCESRWDDRFITFLLAILNPKTNRVRFFNAGHIPPILNDPAKQTKSIMNETGGLPLGIVPDTEYEVFEYEIEKGQSFALMSDGLTDAMNSAGEFYSMQGVIDNLNMHRAASVTQLGRNLVTSVRSFAGRTSQTDDQCLVLFGRTE